jgi:mannose-1-phosphate guanylyltransferase
LPEHNLYALILAGGSGTRLWPRSRAGTPKQFLDLVGTTTMLREAHDRLAPLIPSERVLISTGLDHVRIVSEQLAHVPRENILGEPEGRGTAAAIGLAAEHIYRRDPSGIMAVLTADHLITRRDVFRAALAAAVQVAADGWLVTLGIQPAYPETGYGYVERGAALPGAPGFETYRVARFIEKPSRERAEEFVRAGIYSWNSGMFVWRVKTIRQEFARLMPDLSARLNEIGQAFGTPEEAETFLRTWPSLPKQTIDYGVMEKSLRVAMIPVDIGWSDVGSWSAVYDVSAKDDQGNVVVGNHISVDTTGSLVYSSGRLVATVGLADMVVVDTGDITLVCARDRAQDVKKIVTILQSRGESALL